ncbi:MAG: ATP-binding protein [Alphaproteobacteria bacterium]|nr:ATP-binding protein [Alphaproteobacteria bacterium]
MSNPKDWFRRRRPDAPPPSSGSAEDPFENGAVLELGQSASVVQLGRPEPRLLKVDGARGPDGAHAAPRKNVPPPPPRPVELRPPRIIESHSFAIRPEIAKAAATRDEAARPAALASHRQAMAGEHQVTAEIGAGIPRTRAVPLVRPVAVAKVPPRGEPSDVPNSEPRLSPAADPAGSAPQRAEAAADADRDKKAAAGTPSFAMTAPGVPWLRRGGQIDGAAAFAALRDAFTPTRPKRQTGAFFGRYAQMQRIISAIEEERAHVVLYGERGSGKTSLANIVALKAEEAGYFVAKFACSSELSFEDIFRSFLRRMPATFLAEGIGGASRIGLSNFEELLPPGEIGVAELVAVLGRIHDKHAILVIDEYDRITSEVTKGKLAELLKNMADASVPVTLLMIGVADDVDALLGKHPSLQRALVTIPLPLMTAREIDGIIQVGEEQSGLRFAPEVRQRVVELAQGLPYHAQLLSLFAARSALRRQSRTVEREDLRYAVLRAAEEAEGKLKEAYSLAAASQQGGTAFKDILFAAARSASDPFGVFTVAEVAKTAAAHGIALSTLSLQYPLKKLTEPSRGAMLRRITGLDGLRYQFSSQMMRHHVLVRQAIERGLV